MAKLGQLDYDQDNFDRNRTGFVPLPDGAYNVEIVEVEQKKWDDGGVQLGITYKVIDGECEGRTVFDNLQLVNKSSDVQQIARSSLHKICDNLEVPWPLADDELLMGGTQTIILRSKAKGDKTYQNIVSRDVLQTGRSRQQNAAKEAAPAATPRRTNNRKAEANNDAPW